MTYKTYKSDTTYERFVKRWEEVTDLPPQTLGPLTPHYKALVKRLKVMPWPAFVAVGVLTVVGLYFLLGTTIVFLTTLLQRGF